MKTYDFSAIEEKINTLLEASSFNLLDTEKEEVLQYINANEFGLALETLMDIIIEENKKISYENSIEIRDLIGAMQMRNEKYNKIVQSHLK